VGIPRLVLKRASMERNSAMIGIFMVASADHVSKDFDWFPKPQVNAKIFIIVC
jgi:hypothetical protein